MNTEVIDVTDAIDIPANSNTGMVQRQSAALATATDFQWTPETLKAQIANETQLRTILVSYMKEAMQEGHHFYRIDKKDDGKPTLSKEGAYNLCSIFKVTALDPDIFETWHDDKQGHYTVRTRTRLVDRSGAVIATGDGLATTKESKWAFRKSERTCPECGLANIRKSKNGGWYCWKRTDGCGANFDAGDQRIESQETGRIDNENLPDLYNTVLKISGKRSYVDAVLKLPLVSELFGQDLDESHLRKAMGIEDQTDGEDAKPAQRAKTSPSVKDTPKAGTPGKTNKASKPSEKVETAGKQPVTAPTREMPQIFKDFPDRYEIYKNICRTYKDGNYEPDWTAEYIKVEIVNPMFEVANGLFDLKNEAQFDALLEDLKVRIEERQGMANEQVY
jgi:ribosomal protein L37AE/L43A